MRTEDIPPYRRAVEQSRERLSRWNPVDPDDLPRQIAQQSREHRTFLIHAVQPSRDHDIVGKVNVTNVVRGRFESAAIGYDSYDPYAGRGLFADGLRLVIGLAFTPEALGGLGLHRIQATVQPGNSRSAGLLRSLGFQREGFSPRMLWLPGPDGAEAWLDHVSYAILRDEWPAEPYPRASGGRAVVLVNGMPGPATSDLARDLAAELRIPLFSTDIANGIVDDALWRLLESSPVGGVVEGQFRSEDALVVVHGLRRCSLDPSMVPEVWCVSHGDHGPRRPLGLGPTVTVDTGESLSRAQIVRIALQVGA